MFLAIVLTAVITALALMVLYGRVSERALGAENARLRDDNARLARRIDGYIHDAEEQRLKRAYENGLYDGRETDGLYRSFLSQYRKGERATALTKPLERKGL